MNKQLEQEIERLVKEGQYSYKEVVYLITKLLSKIDINYIFKLIAVLDLGGKDYYNELK